MSSEDTDNFRNSFLFLGDKNEISCLMLHRKYMDEEHPELNAFPELLRYPFSSTIATHSIMCIEPIALATHYTELHQF